MKATTWTALDRRARQEHLGYLPEILLADDPRTVKEQLENRYAHGGGWRPMRTEKWRFDPETMVIRYPGDPPFKPIAFTVINGEKCIFYPACSLLAVVQPDGAWEVTRCD